MWKLLWVRKYNNNDYNYSFLLLLSFPLFSGDPPANGCCNTCDEIRIAYQGNNKNSFILYSLFITPLLFFILFLSFIIIYSLFITPLLSFILIPQQRAGL